MALSESIEYDKIEIVGPYKLVQVRKATVIKKDGVELSRTFNRFVLDPGTLDASNNLIDNSLTKEVDGVTYLDGSLMCDIDMDVCYYRRKEVLKYLEVEFEGKTSKLRTLNTLSSKLVMKECGKIVDDKSEVEMNRVSSMIPKIFGQVKDVKEFREFLKNSESRIERFRPQQHQAEQSCLGSISQVENPPARTTYEDIFLVLCSACSLG